MKLGPLLGAALLLAACGPAPAASNPSGADLGAVIASSAGTVTDVAGFIAANTTWSGKINVNADTTIGQGVTVTVKPGATINVNNKPAATVVVNGALNIEGTSAAPVIVQPAVLTAHWGRFLIPTGGQLTAHYLDETGGGFRLTGGKVTLIDSTMSRAGGDLLEGIGSADVEYSSIGLEPGGVDTTHCDMHFNPYANQLKVTHTNVSTAVYGMMFYGGSGANFTYDNWFSNSINVETVPSDPVSADFSYGWFARNGPSGRGITANHLASSRLPVGMAGPRP